MEMMVTSDSIDGMHKLLKAKLDAWHGTDGKIDLVYLPPALHMHANSYDLVHARFIHGS